MIKCKIDYNGVLWYNFAAIDVFAPIPPTCHCDRSHKSITKNALKSTDFSAFFTGAGGIRDLFLQSKNKFATPRFWSGYGKILLVGIVSVFARIFRKDALKKSRFADMLLM